MLKLFDFACPTCGERHEKLVKDAVADAPECSRGHGKTAKILTAPAFRFKNGVGTDMGNSMAIPGYSLPQG